MSPTCALPPSTVSSFLQGCDEEFDCDQDDVAYVRFASVYRQFSDVNTFMEELKDMLDSRSKTAEK